MKNPQLPLLALHLIVNITNLQTLRRQIQHPAHTILGRVEEIPLRQFGGNRLRARLDVQIHPLLHRDFRLAFRRALQRREVLRRRRGCRFGFGDGRFGHAGFLRGAPGAQLVEGGAAFVFLRLLLGPGADGDQVFAVVFVGEAVFEAVGAVAFVAVHAGDEGGVDQRFAGRVGALLLVGEDVGFGGEGGGAIRLSSTLVGGGAIAGPFAGLGAFVGGFGAVVEAELAVWGRGLLVGLGLGLVGVGDVPTLCSSRIGRGGGLVGDNRAFGSARRSLLRRRWTSC